MSEAAIFANPVDHACPRSIGFGLAPKRYSFTDIASREGFITNGAPVSDSVGHSQSLEKRRMHDDQPSYTAIHVAATRAAHLRFDPAPHLLEDVPAEALLGDEFEALIEQSNEDAHWVLRENRLFIPLRARWAEDRLRRAFENGTKQFIVLGAGLDSFAFRQGPDLSALSIIEVDHPATQGWKRTRLERLGWAAPPNLHFVECDFVKTSMTEALLARGAFDPDQPAFFSWMGVTYYLERALARGALAELETLLGPRSEIVFDYLRPYDDLSPRYAELEQLSGQYLKGKGEPHVNKLRDADVRSDILESGFKTAHIETAATLGDRYGSQMNPSIPLSERFGLAAALK